VVSLGTISIGLVILGLVVECSKPRPCCVVVSVMALIGDFLRPLSINILQKTTKHMPVNEIRWHSHISSIIFVYFMSMVYFEAWILIKWQRVLRLVAVQQIILHVTICILCNELHSEIERNTTVITAGFSCIFSSVLRWKKLTNIIFFDPITLASKQKVLRLAWTFLFQGADRPKHVSFDSAQANRCLKPTQSQHKL